jgi:hypothetical protein
VHKSQFCIGAITGEGFDLHACAHAGTGQKPVLLEVRYISQWFMYGALYAPRFYQHNRYIGQGFSQMHQPPSSQSHCRR